MHDEWSQEEIERRLDEHIGNEREQIEKKERAARLADKYIGRDGSQPAKHGPADQKEIDRLARLPTLECDREREAVAERLGVRVTALDEAIKEARKKSARSEEIPPEFDPDELKRSAREIIENANILDLFAAEFSKAIAGEATNGKLLYLIGTSRLFDDTMHAAVKGTSAGGKSEIRKRVLEFFPPESVVSFTALSERALLYFEGDFAHKILSMGEAAAAEEQAFLDYLLRTLMSERCIRYQHC